MSSKPFEPNPYLPEYLQKLEIEREKAAVALSRRTFIKSSSTAAALAAGAVTAPIGFPTVARAAGVLISVSVPDGGIVSGSASAIRLDGWTTEDLTIDPSVGLAEMIDVGTPVRPGSPLCIVHAAHEADAEEAIALIRQAVRIGDAPPADRPIVIERVVK